MASGVFRLRTPEDRPFRLRTLMAPPTATNSRDGGKISVNNPPSDLCVKCGLTVEEDCVRLGTYQRWHSYCVQCGKCGKLAAVQSAKEKEKNAEEKDKAGEKNE